MKPQISICMSTRTRIESIILGVTMLLIAGVLSLFGLELARNAILFLAVPLTIFGTFGLFRAKKANNIENSN